MVRVSPRTPPPEVQRLRAPAWTRAHLERVLDVKYGRTVRGGLNLRAAAADLGISDRTLRRYLEVPDGRHLARIPQPRLELLMAQLLPSQETLDDELNDLRAFREGIAGWNARPRLVNPAWKEQGWLTRHQVTILHLTHTPLRQVVVTLIGSKGHENLGRRGDIVDALVVPTRLHASVAALQLLRIQHAWRIHAPLKTVREGSTRCWFNTAPKITFSDLVIHYTPTAAARAAQANAREDLGIPELIR